MQWAIGAIRREWLTILLVTVGFYVGRASMATNPPAAALRSDTAFVQLNHGGTVFCRPVELLNHFLLQIVATPPAQCYLWSDPIENAIPVLAAVDDETCRLEGARAIVSALRAYSRVAGDSNFADGFAACQKGEKLAERPDCDADTERLLREVFDHAGYLQTYSAAERTGLQ